MPLTTERRVSGSGSFDQIVPSAARTASGSSSTFYTYGPITGIVFQVNVTAVSGTTPTLAVKVEDSVDGTNWNQVQTTSSITATGITLVRVDLRTTPVTERLRFTWTIGGTTPSFTFAVDSYTMRS